MEPARPLPQSLELVPDRSALASARLHRRLTVEQAAKRAGLTADQVEWLEEGRVYRFPSVDHAIEATLLLSSALEIDRREARELAGLPVPPLGLDVNPVARLVGVAALSAALMALVAFVVGELFDLADIGDSAHKTIEKHFLHALDGIMSGNGNEAVDAMVIEFEKTASLLRGIAVTEQLRTRISEIRTA